jgi:hypothetical protein
MRRHRVLNSLALIVLGRTMTNHTCDHMTRHVVEITCLGWLPPRTAVGQPSRRRESSGQGRTSGVTGDRAGAGAA